MIVYKIYDEEFEEIMGKNQVIKFANYRLSESNFDIEWLENKKVIKAIEKYKNKCKKVTNLDTALDIIKNDGFSIKKIIVN